MRGILLVLALVASVGVWSMANSSMAESPPVAPVPVPPVATETAFPQAMTDRVMGKADAPITLIEYYALTCPHCGHFHLQILPELKKNYIDTGKLRIVFREFPFDQRGLRAAMTARCLDPKVYFDFVHTLFTTQTSWAEADNGETTIKQMAGFAGLSNEQYDKCIADKPLETALMEGRVKATNELNINSTPTFLFEGGLERIVGAQTYEQFATVLDRHLAKLQPAQ